MQLWCKRAWIQKTVPMEQKKRMDLYLWTEKRVLSGVKREKRAPTLKRRSAALSAGAAVALPRDGNEAQMKEGAVQREEKGVQKGGKEAEAPTGEDKVNNFILIEDFLN